MKLLVSAYACEPGKGSEPGVGWNWVSEMARFHEVWVITRKNNRDSIEQELAKHPAPGLRCVYYDLPAWARFWKKGQRGIRLYYYLWQLGAYRVARQLHASIHFDVSHHLTFGTAWLPSLIAWLPMPFVWGPVGGVEPYPNGFLRQLPWRGRLSEGLKALAKIWGRVDPFVRVTARRATLILAQTPATVSFLPKCYRGKAIVFPAVGISHVEMSTRAPNADPPATLRILSVGRLLHFKGFDLGLKAFSILVADQPASEYHIIGDGPERQRLESYASQLRVLDRVKFWGSLPRDRVLALFSESHVYLHPSVREPPVSVITEGMALGLPVVCLDLGGPGLQVTSKTGFKVQARTPEAAAAGLGAALLCLARDPHLRTKMGAAAMRHVAKNFEWGEKRKHINHFYERAVSAPRL